MWDPYGIPTFLPSPTWSVLLRRTIDDEAFPDKFHWGKRADRLDVLGRWCAPFHGSSQFPSQSVTGRELQWTLTQPCERSKE